MLVLLMPLAAATIIQHAYTKYINHFMTHHPQHVMTNASTQLDGKLETIMRAITTRLDNNNTGFDDFKLDNNTQFDKFIAKLDNYKLIAKDKFIAKLDNYTNTATDNIVGDDRLHNDNGNFLFYFHGDCFIYEDFFFQPAIFFLFCTIGELYWVGDYILCTTIASLASFCSLYSVPSSCLYS